MNRKIVFITLLTFLFNFLLSAQEPTNVQNELLRYINQDLADVAGLEKEALDAYASVTGENFTDDVAMYETMTNTVLPVYATMTSKLEVISASLDTNEIEALNAIYIAAAKIQFNGFNMITEGVKKGDTNMVLLANKKLDRARRLISEWRIELQELCEQYGVKLNN